MYLEFVDADGATGRVSTDWAVEYDGQFSETIGTIVSEAKYDGNASGDELQDLSVALFLGTPLREIRFADNGQPQHKRNGEL